MTYNEQQYVHHVFPFFGIKINLVPLLMSSLGFLPEVGQVL